MKQKKKLLVGIVVDYMGGGQQEPDEEIEDIKRQVNEYLTEYDVEFVTSLNVLDLIAKNLDIFIVDYGGVLPGAGGLVSSMMRAVNDYAEEHPSCVVVLWTMFTAGEYKEEMGYSEEDVIGDSIKGSNIIIKEDVHVEELWKTVKERLL